MTPNPYTISPDSTVAEAWRLMSDHKHTHLPVLEKQRVLGIITLKDFGTRPYFEFFGNSSNSHFISPEQEKLLRHVRVRDLMPHDQGAVVIGADAPIEQAAKLLLDNKLSGLPVVDELDHLVGIITQTDILSSFLDLMAINRRGARINLRIDDDPLTLSTIGQILHKHGTRIDNLVTMQRNGEKSLMVLSIKSTEVKPIVNDLRAAGLEVESTLVKP